MLGSPPPTRGTLYSCAVVSELARITPAYAGNTLVKDGYLIASKDHPRLRGEHFAGTCFFLNVVGSPPPTRGTPSYLP